MNPICVSEMQSRNRNATLRKSLHATETRWSGLKYAFIDPKAKCSLSESTPPGPKQLASSRKTATAVGEDHHRIRTGSIAPQMLSQLFVELGIASSNPG